MKHFSGYIEGYYGRLLSWDDRAQLLTALKRLGLNTYVYGPKEDPFHRVQWKHVYPREWTGQFTRFVKDGKKKNITVVACLSPGLSYDYRDGSDYRALLRKFTTFIACGAETVSLFMDDIPETLPKNSVQSYSSLGQAHAVLLSRLQNDLRKHYPRVSLWFCPTVYCDSFAKGGIRKNRYLLDLSKGLPRDVMLFWTGPSVISDKIDKKNIAPVSDLFCGNIVIWDNLYANDYCPHRLFAGPYRGRSRAVLSSIRGICLNPTGLPQTDMLLLRRLYSFVNNHPVGRTPHIAFDDISLPDAFGTVARFFDSPFAKTSRSDFTPRKRTAYEKALHYLLGKWKSPLQREWYPFLYMLDNDLKLLDRSGKKEISANWLFKKYPPALSTVLAEVLCIGKPGKE
jgi:hyaluronoglucosaminidase